MAITAPAHPASSEIRLDLRGLKCPMPVLRAKKELPRLEAGMVLAIECTDPMAAIDLPNLARETGDAYEGQQPGDGFVTYFIRKVAAR